MRLPFIQPLIVHHPDHLSVSWAVGGMMDLEANLKLIGRTTAAIEENDIFSAIPL